MYVNDISTAVSSTVKLYADGTKLYRELESISDDTCATIWLVSTYKKLQNGAKPGSWRLTR